MELILLCVLTASVCGIYALGIIGVVIVVKMVKGGVFIQANIHDSPVRRVEVQDSPLPTLQPIYPDEAEKQAKGRQND
jgi:hypothetical protein